jgi:hypothetical protein
MAKYASNTTVSADRSKAEIERTLIRYGVDEFFYGRSASGAGIGFTFKGRTIKLNVPMPSRNDYRDNKAGEDDWNRERRRLWRVLLLSIKADLEAIDSGLKTFEDVYLAYTCLPNGSTVGQEIQEKIDVMVTGGQMPKLLT